MKNLFLIALVLVLAGCGNSPVAPAPEPPPTVVVPPKQLKPWETQPRDEKGRWISELTDYARKNNITPEAAEAAGVPFEQYVYDYSVSHGPALDVKAKEDYDRWLIFSKKKGN